MTREVTDSITFTHDPKFRLSKEVTWVACDDGAVYEFVRPTDEPAAKLTRAVQPDGEVTHTSSGVLPSAVEETADSILGGFRK